MSPVVFIIAKSPRNCNIFYVCLQDFIKNIQFIISKKTVCIVIWFILVLLVENYKKIARHFMAIQTILCYYGIIKCKMLVF